MAIYLKYHFYIHLRHFVIPREKRAKSLCSLTPMKAWLPFRFKYVLCNANMNIFSGPTLKVEFTLQLFEVKSAALIVTHFHVN